MKRGMMSRPKYLLKPSTSTFTMIRRGWQVYTPDGKACLARREEWIYVWIGTRLAARRELTSQGLDEAIEYINEELTGSPAP